MSPAGISERTTRKELVDRALAAADWRVISHARWLAGDRTPADAVEEFPTDSGPADYLLHLDGQPAADVGAKKLSVDPANVIEQAKRCSRTFAGSPFRFGDYHIPFAYSHNGELIYTCELRDNLLQTREIERFHTPDALREALARDLAGADLWLRTHPIEDPDRYYQREAIGAIENALRNYEVI